jgi:two-component system KDP operon response regulator KdpE
MISAFWTGVEMTVHKAHRKCILFVDDEVGLHRAIARSAAEVGIEVVHAMTALDGVRLAMERRPDLIVLDMGMPDLDGIQVLTRLKAAPKTASIPVVIYSAHNDHDQRIEAFQIGAEDYFEKPFDLDMLMRRIEHHIFKSSESRPVSGVLGPTDDTVPHVKRLAR